MIKRSKILILAVGVLALGAPIQADMMPVSALGAGHQQPAPTCIPANVEGTEFGGAIAHCAGAADFTPFSFEFLPKGTVEASQTSETQPSLILTDGQGSLSLCLYALISLGLCRSAPWVKRFSFGVIPEWYHNGGPSQIGHSLAISPNCLCTAVVCFIQPDRIADDPIPQYRQRTVTSLWRESQFAPTLLASRGPPLHPENHQLS